MKKVLLLLVLLVLGGVIVLALLGGRNGGPLRYIWNPEAAEVLELAESFLEDLQYKDFDAAAAYHTFADQAEVDIPQLIERMFRIKPEQLNIRDIHITDVDLDSSGKRARAFFIADIELLNSGLNNPEGQNEERRVEGVLYWHRRPAGEGEAPPEEGAQAPPLPAGDQWFMMLESSLH